MPQARMVSLPAPVGGLNLLSSLTQMKAHEALVLDNYFPQPNNVELRNGHSSHATGFGATVQTLIPFHGGTGTNKLFGAASTAIYDCTSSGAIGAAAVSSLTNAKWQFVQFSAGGGDYVVLVNGADGVRTFDGTTWATQTITGATAANFVDVASHKSRLWFIENASTSVWYLGSGAISGAASELDLGPVFRLGGTVAFAVPISFNAGAGFDDGLCFVSTEGEVALYVGTDPASANTWALSGVFRIARPVRQRGYTRLAGDALVLTTEGVVSLLASMRLDPSQYSRAEVSYKIDPTLKTQVADQGSTFGWQMIVYPSGTQMIVNAPQSSTVAHQWVMNTVTSAWCRYKGINASCWGLLGDTMYVAVGAVVYKFDSGNDDAGVDIAAGIKWAFNSLGANRVKRVTMIRPYVLSNGSPPISVGLDADFSDNAPVDVPTGNTALTGAVWDTAVWGTDVWGGASNTLRQWALAGALGTWIAPRIATSTQGYAITFNAVDLMYEPTGAPIIG